MELNNIANHKNCFAYFPVKKITGSLTSYSRTDSVSINIKSVKFQYRPLSANKSRSAIVLEQYPLMRETESSRRQLHTRRRQLGKLLSSPTGERHYTFTLTFADM